MLMIKLIGPLQQIAVVIGRNRVGIYLQMGDEEVESLVAARGGSLTVIIKGGEVVTVETVNAKRRGEPPLFHRTKAALEKAGQGAIGTCCMTVF